MRLLTLVAALLFCSAPALWAQQPSPAEPADEETDLPELIRAWRQKPPPPEKEPGHKAFIVAPVIGSNPSAGFLIGAAGQMTMFRGDPATTSITSGIASLTISSKKQVVFNVRFDSFSDGNRWLIEGDNRFQSTSQNIYGFGSNTPSSTAIGTDYGFVRIHETLFRQVATNFYVGGGFLLDSHTDVSPADASDPNWPTSPYLVYSQQHGLPASSQQSAGFSVNMQLNHRDNEISARRGWIVSSHYRWSFDGLLGGDSSWQEFAADARVYVPFDSLGRHRIALWSYTDLVTQGVAPYFDVPATVMDTYGRSARGYQDGRYRGERLVYGEAEYRGPLMSNGLLGMVAFATMTTVSNSQTGEKLFDSLAPSVGGGLRLLLSKRSRTNLCFDLAWGKDGAKGVYLAIQDAF
jgi:outer membrane protein assembly factor BamA